MAGHQLLEGQAGGKPKPSSPESKNAQFGGRGATSEGSSGKSTWEGTRRCGIGLGSWHGGSVGQYFFSMCKSSLPNSVTATGKGSETIIGSGGLAF